MKNKEKTTERVLEEIKLSSKNKVPSEERLKKRIENVLKAERNSESVSKTKFLKIYNYAISNRVVMFAANFLLIVLTYYIVLYFIGENKQNQVEYTKNDVILTDTMSRQEIITGQYEKIDTSKADAVIEEKSIEYDVLAKISIDDIYFGFGFAIDESAILEWARDNLIAKVDSVLDLSLNYQLISNSSLSSEWFYAYDNKQIYEVRIMIQFDNEKLHISSEKKLDNKKYQKNLKKTSIKKYLQLKKNF